MKTGYEKKSMTTKFYTIISRDYHVKDDKEY